MALEEVAKLIGEGKKVKFDFDASLADGIRLFDGGEVEVYIRGYKFVLKRVMEESPDNESELSRPVATLSVDRVLDDIRQGMKPKDVAEKYNVSRQKIYNLKYRYMSGTTDSSAGPAPVPEKSSKKEPRRKGRKTSYKAKALEVLGTHIDSKDRVYRVDAAEEVASELGIEKAQAYNATYLAMRELSAGGDFAVGRDDTGSYLYRV